MTVFALKSPLLQHMKKRDNTEFSHFGVLGHNHPAELYVDVSTFSRFSQGQKSHLFISSTYISHSLTHTQQPSAALLRSLVLSWPSFWLAIKGCPRKNLPFCILRLHYFIEHLQTCNGAHHVRNEMPVTMVGLIAFCNYLNNQKTTQTENEKIQPSFSAFYTARSFLATFQPFFLIATRSHLGIDSANRRQRLLSPLILRQVQQWLALVAPSFEGQLI